MAPGEDAARDVLSHALGTMKGFDPVHFAQLESRIITPVRFFGSWYDPADGGLIFDGRINTTDGRCLTRPKYRDLKGVKHSSSGYGCKEEAGSGGDFAHLFCQPPYGLHARPEDVQAMFDAITSVILPKDEDAEIRDWTTVALAEVSPYFKAGLEWWGILLATIYLPQSRKLSVIMASTTD